MKREGMTIREAAREWVSEMNAIPYSLVEKLSNYNNDELHEITPPGRGDYVYILSGEFDGEYGYIENKVEGNEDRYIIQLDGKEDEIELEEGDFEVQRDGYFPMWGTLWAFGEQLDNDWITGQYCESGRQAMADCGFRIYEQEDYEYIFGIDGAGYDFYESHFIPLYLARGLAWHDKSLGENYDRYKRHEIRTTNSSSSC
jgi:hypothetical protein